MKKNLIFFYNSENLKSNENYFLYGNYNKYENTELKKLNINI